MYEYIQVLKEALTYCFLVSCFDILILFFVVCILREKENLGRMKRRMGILKQNQGIEQREMSIISITIIMSHNEVVLGNTSPLTFHETYA